MMNNVTSRSLRDTGMSHNDLEHVPYEWIEGGECVVCRTPFEGLHLLSQRTCSDTCRKRLQRTRQNEKQALNRTLRELQVFRGGIKRGERLPEFVEELNRLKGEINDLLLLAGDTDQKSKHEMVTGYKIKHL